MSEYIYTTEGTFGLRECTGEEIVRCRDCKEFAFGSDEYAVHDWCYYWDSYVESPDGFCKWGERRDE